VDGFSLTYDGFDPGAAIRARAGCEKPLRAGLPGGAALGNRTPDLRITRSPGHRSGRATCTDSTARVPERSECTGCSGFSVHDPVHDRAGLPVTECHLRGRRMALTQGHRLFRRFFGQRGRG